MYSIIEFISPTYDMSIDIHIGAGGIPHAWGGIIMLLFYIYKIRIHIIMITSK